MAKKSKKYLKNKRVFFSMATLFFSGILIHRDFAIVLALAGLNLLARVGFCQDGDETKYQPI